MGASLFPSACPSGDDFEVRASRVAGRHGTADVLLSGLELAQRNELGGRHRSQWHRSATDQAQVG
jgi:hypothetical protein